MYVRASVCVCMRVHWVGVLACVYMKACMRVLSEPCMIMHICMVCIQAIKHTNIQCVYAYICIDHNQSLFSLDVYI